MFVKSYITTMYDLTGFQRDCLYVIAGLGSPKGLAIKDELDGYYEGEINHGRLYPNLDELVDKGFVEKGRQHDRTNSYTLTQRGERELDARREWEDERAADVLD
jgi:DNA-binding PadR family transcriptional regulator